MGPILTKALGKLTAEKGETLVTTIADSIDKFVQTPDEKSAVMQKINDAVMNYQQETEKELTERLRIDMNSDSWLSKNIRPMTLIYLSIIISLLCILDSSNFGFKVKDVWIDVFKWAWMSALAFYFVGREITKNIQSKKSDQ